MPRVRKGAARRRQHKKILKSTRGYIGAASRRYRVAREAWLRAGQYATIGRKLRKRDFRRLWITRISAACRQRGMLYSRFMHALSAQGIRINRKVLADMAVSDPGAFDELVAVASGRKPTQVAQEKPPARKVVADEMPAEEGAAKEEAPAAEQAAVGAEAETPEPPVEKAAAGKRRTRKKPAGEAEAGAPEEAEAPPKPKAKKKAATKKRAAKKTAVPKAIKKAAAKRPAAKKKPAADKTPSSGGTPAKKKSAARTKKKSASAKKPKKGQESKD
ncbi:MAG: 50S ribosomal protein L20 [Planctomycetales bacterium 4484_123]|nr:MAG: 50S ribosomal protein L20 [Planctomycetales bacterium 4484_123]